MSSSSKSASAKGAGQRLLQLPRPSVPHQRGLLRGREISLYYDRPGPSHWADHAYAQAKIAVLFEPAVGLFSWRAPSGQPCEQRLTGRQIRGVPPGQRHAWQWEQAGEVILIFLEPSFLRRLPQKNWRCILTGTARPFVYLDPVFWQLAFVLRALCEESQQSAEMTVIEALACTLALRYFALDGQSPLPLGRPLLSPEHQQRVLEYIRKNFANPGLRVAQLAKLVALSPPHFTEIFRLTLGRPPMEQVRRYRLLHAHELVEKCNHRMGEIADACGFCDVSHLGREFRNFFGYPPRLLRGGTRPVFPPALPPDRPGLTITPVYFSEISEPLTGCAPLPANAKRKIQHPQFT